MKIALIGTRGVPAQYGGFETCAEELGKRLVERGHNITVYCRAGYYKEKRSFYLGMELVTIKEPGIKPLETLLHTFFSLLHAIRKDYDILLVFNSANSPWILLPKIAGKKVILHVDGLEWKRDKWSTLGKKYYKFAEWLSTKYSIELISDSKEIQKHFFESYGKKTHYLSYGAYLKHSHNISLLDRFNLRPHEYFLQVTRFEPENNSLLSVRAFEQIDTEKQLVLVGGLKYRTPYVMAMFATKDPRIHFLGFIYEKDLLRELFCNSYAYIHGNEVGGTNPALLEAMACGNYVVSRDVPFNREVLQDAGIYFKKSTRDLREKLVWTLQNEELLIKNKQKAKKIIQQNYNWDSVVDKYERLFQSILKGQD